MPKIPPMKPKDVMKKFQKLGYVKDRQTGSNVILYHPAKGRAVIPLHVRDLPKGTLLAIIKEAGLSKEEFLNI